MNAPLRGLVLSVAAGTAAAQAQFVARTPGPIAASHLTVAAVADFDADGDPDVLGYAFLFVGPPTVRLLRNDGNERFTDLSATHLPATPFGIGATDVLAFDCDGNGSPDILSTEPFGVARLWLNNGAGQFSVAGGSLPVGSYGLRDMAATDLDQDGDLDVLGILATLGGGVQMWINQGGGTFVDASVWTWGTAQGFALLDLENDGDRDVVFTQGPTLRVFRNDGSLVFTDVTAAWSGGVVLPLSHAPAAGDLDNDGDPDLVVGGETSNPDTVLRNTGMSFVASGTIGTSALTTRQLLLVDVDRDGDLDAVRGHDAGASLAINDGTGNLVHAPNRLIATAGTTRQLRGADFDRDGDVDLLVCDNPGSRVLVNRHVDLVVGQPTIGQNWTIDVWSQPGYAAGNHIARAAIGLAGLPQPLPLAPFGELWLDISAPFVLFQLMVPFNTGVANFAFPLPNATTLVGLPLHVQGLVEAVPSTPRLSAYRGGVVQ